MEKKHKTISLDHPLLKEIYDKHLHRGSKPKTGALKQNKMKAHGSSSASSGEEKEEEGKGKIGKEK